MEAEYHELACEQEAGDEGHDEHRRWPRRPRDGEEEEHQGDGRDRHAEDGQAAGEAEEYVLVVHVFRQTLRCYEDMSECSRRWKAQGLTRNLEPLAPL